MRDHDLGPRTQKLILRYEANRKLEHPDQSLLEVADAMYTLLKCWAEENWCWVDSGPARICGGPHVLVRYVIPRADSTGTIETDVVEPKSRVGETFKEADYAIVIEERTGQHIRRAVPIAPTDRA